MNRYLKLTINSGEIFKIVKLIEQRITRENMNKKRRLTDTLVNIWMRGGLYFLLSIPVLVGIGLYWKAAPILKDHSLMTLIFSSKWFPQKGEFGFLPFIYGSVYVTVLSFILSAPLMFICRHLSHAIREEAAAEFYASGNRHSCRNTIGSLWRLGDFSYCSCCGKPHSAVFRGNKFRLQYACRRNCAGCNVYPIHVKYAYRGVSYNSGWHEGSIAGAWRYPLGNGKTCNPEERDFPVLFLPLDLALQKHSAKPSPF
jgi:hypothetical protein